jgi:hypothetical protein
LALGMKTEVSNELFIRRRLTRGKKLVDVTTTGPGN